MDAFFLPSLVKLEVVERNYLRSPGTSPDLLYWIRDVHDVFLYFKWSLPLSIELVCFSHLVSTVECSVALNLQFERPCV